jgi:serine/threonine-protein kinase/endoribonuclease IRE1
VPSFPQRPGHAVCDFYQKTGHCRFGEGCKFDHPPCFAVPLNARGLPLRPGQTVCAFYQRTGDCKFGPSCKFDHPDR